jgi:hypothetical protein
VDEARLSPEDLRAVGEDGLGEKILAGLSSPGGLLTYLRDEGVTENRLYEAAEEAQRSERSRGQISSPDGGDGDLAHAANSAPRLVRLSRVLERLADEVACGRMGPAYSLLSDGSVLIAQGRRPWMFDNQRLLLLDGTANPEILRQFVPHLEDVPEIQAQRKAHIIQIRDLTFFRGRLVEKSPAAEEGPKWRPTARLGEVAEFIAKVAREGRTLVVTNKRVRCALTGENANGRLTVSGSYAGADIAHFGNIRGIDEFKDHDAVIILGRDQPSARAAERRAMAIWYDTKQPIRRISPGAKLEVQYPYRARQYTMRDGSQQRPVRVRVHPDRRVQAVVEQVREAEMVHAIDRLRLIHTERQKTVYILCNIPVGLWVDELVTWRQLVGDGKLAAALGTCEEKGWDALPLAPQELTHLFPELWGTEKAAEGWLGNNPLNPLISIIRLWGVIHLYRPKGRRGKWSRALVRHGTDPVEALAGVLGVPIDDIRVRDCDQRDKMSTSRL